MDGPKPNDCFIVVYSKEYIDRQRRTDRFLNLLFFTKEKKTFMKIGTHVMIYNAAKLAL